ncbi:hypothetical protein KKC13_13080 [bacterium]|nr:hypothetical protein [bacterium]MBU1958394.1 hypothetical protein [bacterium]
MKKLKLLFLSLLLVFFSACGTGTSSEIDPDRGFDMWEYMTSTLNYEVEYAIYENNVETDYYVETHKMYTDEYVRESSSGVTTLLLNGNRILMREPSEDVTIERYVYLGDRGVFQSASIQLCSVEHFYETYTNKGMTFHNVLMIGCTSRSGVNQEFYYGYNEGIVYIYKNDGVNEIEWLKVAEEPIF